MVPLLLLLLIPRARDQIMRTLLEGGGWIREQGAVGWLIYILVYIIWVSSLLPQTAVELLAGWIFEYPVAAVLATLARAIATVLMCTGGRVLARQFVTTHVVAKSQFLQALMVVVEQHPRRGAALISIMTMPIWCKNYLWSVVAAPIWYMVAAQVLCMLPYSLFTCYIGNTSQNMILVLTGEKELSPGQMIFSVVGIITGVIVLTIMGYLTKRELDRMVAKPEADQELDRMVIELQPLELEIQTQQPGYDKCPLTPNNLE